MWAVNNMYTWRRSLLTPMPVQFPVSGRVPFIAHFSGFFLSVVPRRNSEEPEPGSRLPPLGHQIQPLKHQSQRGPLTDVGMRKQQLIPEGRLEWHPYTSKGHVFFCSIPHSPLVPPNTNLLRTIEKSSFLHPRIDTRLNTCKPTLSNALIC
jgi:hypothetical protein